MCYSHLSLLLFLFVDIIIFIVMNWLPKKFFTSKLREYFHIEDEDNIQVQLSPFGTQEIRCTNLILKPEAVNKPESLVHVSRCRISELHVIIDRSKMSKQPISIKIDRINLTIMFNPDRKMPEKKETQGKKKERPKLDEFYKAVGSEKQYQERSFLQEQIFQIKRMFGEYFLGKLCIKITNIDLSVQYKVAEELHYLGVQIEEIQLKERLVYKGVTAEDDKGSEEIHCLLKNIGVYLGVKYEKNVVNRQAEHREIVKRVQKRSKKFLISKQCINLYYSMEEKLFTIVTSEINIELEDILIHELVSFTTHLSEMTSNEPRLRPGEGEPITLPKTTKNSKYSSQMKVSKGTLEWWQDMGNKIVKKFNERENLNILKNKKFREYLFCLLYRYTYGAKVQLEQIIQEYEFFKSDIQIMRYNLFILQKIDRIQNTDGVDLESKGFIIFLNFANKKQWKLKPIDYDKVRKSRVTINLDNCRKFIQIQQSELQDYMTVNIKINFITLSIIKPENFAQFKADICTIPYPDFIIKKKQILDFYCKELILKAPPVTSTTVLPESGRESIDRLSMDATKRPKRKTHPQAYAIIEIVGLQCEYGFQGNFYVSMPTMTITDMETNIKILQINSLDVMRQNMRPEIYHWKITTEQRFQMKVDLIYVNVESLFVEKLLVLKSYVVKREQETVELQPNYLTKLINKKVPSHWIFNTYSKTSKSVIVNEVIVATPVFEKDRNLLAALINLEYNDPVDEKTTFGIEKTMIERSSYENVNDRLQGKRKNKVNDQVVLMASTRPFSGFISSTNNVDLTSILVPFMLIQISCQDIFYIMNIMKVWKRIMNNPYYFAPKIVSKVVGERKIKDTEIAYAKKMQQEIDDKCITEIKLQGIEFFFNSDFVNEGSNKILNLLVDTLIFQSSASFSSDSLTLSLKDVFIRNSLIGQRVDKNALFSTLRKSCFFEEEPILISTGPGDQKMEGQLLLYSDSPIPRNYQSESQPFLSVTSKGFLDLNQLSMTTTINIHLYPLFMFYSNLFFEAMWGIFSIIMEVSEETVGEWVAAVSPTMRTNPYMGAGGDQNQIQVENIKQIQVLAAPQFSIITELSLMLDRINLLILEQSKVVFSITIGELTANHRSEPYIQKYYFKSKRFIVIDTSVAAGPYPIIIDAKYKDGDAPLSGSFTSYNSEILRHRENRSAFFKLRINCPEVYFLKKKVMELVNVLNLILRQLGITQEPSEDSPSKESQKGDEERQPALQYLITIISPQIKLLRSSLSDEGLNSLINSIVISNYIVSAEEEPQIMSVDDIMRDITKFSQMSEQGQDHFSLCLVAEEEIDLNFRSFEKETHTNEAKVDKIYIKINEMHIFGYDNWKRGGRHMSSRIEPERPMLEIPHINIQFFDSKLIADIPLIYSLLEEEDFRVLIRLTEQNLSESPLMFVVPNIPKGPIKISFATQFSIGEMIMRFNKQVEEGPQHKKIIKTNELKVVNMRGKNQLWTNNQNETELSIQDLYLSNEKQVKFIFNKSIDENEMGTYPAISVPNVYTDFDEFNEIKKLESQLIKLEKRMAEHTAEEYFQVIKGNEEVSVVPDEVDAKKETNTQKISRWVRGMCRKCWSGCACCKNKKQQKQKLANEIAKAIIKQGADQAELVSEQHLISGEKNPLKFIIKELESVLGFEYQLDYSKIRKKKKEQTMIYLDFCIKPSGQKHMYLQAKSMKVLMQPTKSLLTVIQFFMIPYTNPQDPPTLRRIPFNNNKGFKMLVELNDSMVEIKNEDNGRSERLTVLLDAIYDNQTRGDNTKGPGITTMKVESLVKLMYSNDFIPNPLDLSDIFKASYYMRQTVPYYKGQKTHSTQKIVLTSPHQFRLCFYIPIWIVKSLNRIVAATFQQQPPEQQDSNIKKSVSQKHQKQKPQKMPSSAQYGRNRSNFGKKSDQLNYQQDEMGRKPNEPQLKQKNQYEKQQVERNKEQDKKKENKPNNEEKKGVIVKRSMFVPIITLEVKDKINSCFLRAVISNIRYMEFNVSLDDTNFAMREMKANLSTQYWNLKLGVFEPCIEPWNFKLNQVVNTRQKISSSNLKVSSDISSWIIQDDRYVNDLNINISLALFQTYKELMIKYEQEDYDEDEVCHDLTIGDSDAYQNLFSEPKKAASNVRQPKKMKFFPPQLMTYFGRKFVTEENFTIKKKVKKEDYFNPVGIKLYVYHSYFDHFRRKKRITYRTPYRIFNSTGITLNLWFYVPRLIRQWMIKLKKYQYYAIPSKIYTVDILVNIDQGSKVNRHPEASFISLRYLLETRGRKQNFTLIKPSQKIWKSIFKFSNQTSEKYIDYRDVVLRMGSLSFVAVNCKSNDKTETEILGVKGQKLYDSYTIIMSPITIENYSYYDFWIIINRGQKVLVKKNSRLEINEHLPQDLSETVIEFQDDELHQEFGILNSNDYEPKKTFFIQINKMQSIEVLVSRETLSTCFIEIYAEWNITNYTNLDFRLWHGNRVFLIDKMSFSCLSEIPNKSINMSIVGEEDFAKNIKINSLIDDLVLSKRVRDDKRPTLYRAMKDQKKSKFSCCSCFSSNKLLEHVELVFHMSNDPIYSSSKKVQIKYKYQIRNLTQLSLKLFQHSNDFLIADLSNEQSSSYIYYYDFIPKVFFLEMLEVVEGKDPKKLNSCRFELEKFPGTSFSLKIKKSGSTELLEYHKKFHYLRVDIKKDEEETIIDVMEANFNNFPIYLDNLTNYSIAITQGEQKFMLQPGQRIPFAWTELVPASQDGNQLQVKIDDAQPKIYSFNKKSTFEPIKILGINMNKKKKTGNLYLKQSCFVEYEYMNISGVSVVILDLFDNRLRIHNDAINLQLSMQEVIKMETLASRIELHFSDSKHIQIVPSHSSIKNWVDGLHSCINENVIDSVSFTIEVHKNSRIFFFRTMGKDDYQSNKQEYSISHLNLSIITGSPKEIIDVYLFNVSYSQHDKLNRANYEKYQSNESQKVLTIKKLKINNQTDSAMAPVVLSQIKKSKHPFMELRLCQQKLHLKDEILDQMSSRKKEQIGHEEQQILHYKEVIVFMDEAEFMVEYALFIEILDLNNQFTYIANQYAVGAEMGYMEEVNEEEDMLRSTQRREKLVELPDEGGQKEKRNSRVYINYLEIKPIKVIISVSLEHSKDEEIKLNLIGILRYIPFGIENAIVEIPSYQYTYIFYEQDELQKKFTKYYMQSAYNQILRNVGSYDLLFPIKLLTGLSIGVKNIFYDPFYELVRKKEIKAVGIAFCEGLLNLIVFLLSFLVKMVSLLFKIVAAASFDQQYKTKRESFRRQIFKSPVDAAILGGKNWWNVFKSYPLSFAQIKNDYGGYLCFGYIFGFLLCLIKVIFWIPKLIASGYDLIYVIGLGVLNWGYYEENAMKVRSRPPRTFRQKMIIPYNYLYAYGNEIIHRNQLNEIEDEQIRFVKPVQVNDENSYLILSNYRILYNNSKLSSCQEIKLYQISQLIAQSSKDKKSWKITIILSIPNSVKVLFCFSYNISTYQLQFTLKSNLIKFLKRLKRIAASQNLEIAFNESEEIRNELSSQRMIIQELIFMQREKNNEIDKSVQV